MKTFNQSVNTDGSSIALIEYHYEKCENQEQKEGFVNIKGIVDRVIFYEANYYHSAYQISKKYLDKINSAVAGIECYCVVSKNELEDYISKEMPF